MTRSASRDPDWVGLSEASRVLGVSPATLRRWSDAGRLRVFTTPGGHRRFSRSALERLLPADRSRRPSIGGAGLSPSRIARTYRRASREAAPELPWVLSLSDKQRLLFRERGHVLAASLLQHLDAPQPEAAAHHLQEASGSAAEYGKVAAALGLSLSQTVEGFLRFRAPFHHELAVAARRRGFDTAETTDLLEAAERAMDRLLVATMTGHGAAPGRGRRFVVAPVDEAREGVSGAAPGHIVALVTHARDVPAVERERFAQELRRELTDGALVLETCHRVEAYTNGLGDSEQIALAESLPSGGKTLVGGPAVRHAITVAVGGDSVVVGEDQILHQLRASVDAARMAGSLDPALERLFALALQAGRRARSWRQGPPRSLADVALSSIERQCGPLRGRDVLVVGAGRMGRLTARAALAAGASVAVANRSADGADALAASIGARTEAFDPDAKIGAFAGVVVALAGPWPIGAATIDALAKSATVVVDLSVPAAVPAGLAGILGLRLVTADALALADVGPAAQNGSAARLEALVERSTEEFVAWLMRRDGRTAAEALVKRADREREAELAALWRRLPDLEAEERDAIEGMTRHLADRLLREPLQRLGRDADGRDGRAIRDIFAL